MKKRLPLILVALLAVAAVMTYNHIRSSKVIYAGTLEAEEVDISPGVVSEIQSVEVNEGDKVHAGQLLLKLACQEVRINASNVENEYNRAQKLFEAGSLPKASYDKVRYQHDDAALKLSWCDITAPAEGTVLSVYHRKGEWARPGMNLLTLADLNQLYTFIYVEKSKLVRLKPGLELQGSVPELKGKVFKGRIAFIRPEAEFTPKNVQTRDQRERLVFGVKVTLDNAEGLLNPGLPIEIKIPD
ncbi:MAG: efflux RND transporter periplasmic adaptor subunit [candidate division FCPU426 bacterium]